jgi:hypothetical protein
MSSASNRTVWVAFVAGVGVTLSKVGAAIVTSSPAMAAEASPTSIYRVDIVTTGTGHGT